MNQPNVNLDDELEGFKKSNESILGKISEALLEKYEEGKILLSDIVEAEKILKALNERLKVLQEEEMPAIFDEAGVSGIKLPSGESVEVTTSMHCGIPAARKGEAFDWLRANEHGDLIKNELNIKFGRKQDNSVAELKTLAEGLGLDFEQKEAVHASTLKAFVKEQTRSGHSLPNDLFGIYIRRVVEIKN